MVINTYCGQQEGILRTHACIRWTTKRGRIQSDGGKSRTHVNSRCFGPWVLMSTGARDCLPPRVWVIWVQAVSLSVNGNAEFKARFSRWLLTAKAAEICDLWFALGAKASWSKITNGKENYRVLPRGGIWRRLEQVYGRFPCPTLVNLYIERKPFT